MRKPALLVIDMLNDFLDRWDPVHRGQLVCAINELVQIMRNASRPIIWVRQEFEPDLSDAFLEMRAKKIQMVIKAPRDARSIHG